MQLRKRLAAMSALALAAGAVGVLLPFVPAEAAPPAPVILNNDVPTGANASWLETQNLTDQSHNRIIQSTFLVQHAEGRTIDGVKADFNWDGSDNTAGNALITSGVTVDTYAPAAGDMQTSVVTARINVGNGPDSSGRAFNAPYRMRVVDDTGEQSASVTGTIRFVEEGQSVGSADFPSLRNFTPGQESFLTPGQAVSFGTWQCDDPDVHIGFPLNTDDDDCNRANQRWRRLDDGDIISLAQYTGIGDNQNETVNTTAPPTNGHWVYELQFCNENGSCPTNGGGSSWWRIGKAVVNDAASSLTGSVTFSGAAASTPPSVNPNGVVTANATVSDSNGGQVQVIEWNKNHDSGASADFEDRFYTVPTNTGGNITHPALSSVSGALSRSVDTSTAGLKTVQARITDNGALDAGDLNRRQLTVTSGQLRVNALPIASAVTHTVAEDSGAGTITLVGNDPDAQPAPLEYSTVSGLSNPSLGSLGSVGGNTISFTPAPNANGSATFTYRVRDGNGGTIGANGFSNTATVTINVTPVNDNPTIAPKSITTPEDNNGTVQLTGTDIEPGTLTFSVNPGGQATNGTAVCPASGLCTYTPNPNFFGNDSFVVRGTDSQGGFGTATVSVVVTPVNDAPTANNQSVTVGEDAVNHLITLSGSDIDNVTLTYLAPVGPSTSNGTLSCFGNACNYSPDLDFNGTDSFQFRVNDGSLNSNLATVSITVVAVNDAPVATDVPDAEADEDIPEAITATGTDVDTGDVVTVDSATDPANGSTNITGPNEVTYQGDLDFHGLDTFDFEVTDGNGGFDTGTVSVVVHPVNDAPVIAPQPFTVAEDTPTLLTVAAGDVDGDLLSWSVTGGASDGMIFGTGPDVVYVPDANFHGTDTFTVQVSDGLLTASATMTITVTPVNDQPVAYAASRSTNEDAAISDIVLTSSDIDADAVTYAVGSTPTNGSVVCVADLCEYTPNGNFNGSDLFTFVVSDGTATDEASVSITVDPVNDDPQVTADPVTTPEDTPTAVPLTASDIDGDALSFTYGTATNGIVSGGGPDAVYSPSPNFNGTDAFGVTVDDGNGGSSSTIVDIEVTAVNDAPVATGGTVTTPEEEDVSFSLGATDVENDPLLFGITSPPASGALTCDTAGACLYEPDDDFTGTVTAEYSVFDGAATGNGVVTIIVDPVNDPPVPTGPSSVLLVEDSTIGFSLAATDTEDDPLTFAVVSGPTNGIVTCTPDGSCSYGPSTNFHGSDAFTWSVSDGGATVNGTTTFTVLAVNDAPLALDVSAATNEDTVVDVPLLASDAEGETITYSVDSPPGAGSVTMLPGGIARYTPNTDFSGTDSFTYRATDPHGAFTTARVSLVVNEVALIGSSLVGDAAVAQVQVTLGGPNLAIVVFPKLRATLRTASGAPLVGRTISFSVGGVPVCSATTNAQGAGTCNATIPLLQGVLNLGYQVSFAGDADYAASTAKGPLVQILQLRL